MSMIGGGDCGQGEFCIPGEPYALYTVDEFERLSEPGGLRLELVRGQVVREPAAGFRNSRLGAFLVARLFLYVQRLKLGEIVGADAGFILCDEPPTVRMPAAGFVARERIPEEGLPRGYFPGAPDLAVEIVSPFDTRLEVEAKIRDYLEAGTRLVWVVEPRSRSVIVHRPGREPQTCWEGDEVEGEDVIPGFRLAVEEIFWEE